MTNPSNAGDGARTVSLADQMTSYDALPAELRALYDAAPQALDAREFLLVWQTYGVRALGLIEDLIRKQYPEWTGQVTRHRPRPRP